MSIEQDKSRSDMDMDSDEKTGVIPVQTMQELVFGKMNNQGAQEKDTDHAD